MGKSNTLKVLQIGSSLNDKISPIDTSLLGLQKLSLSFAFSETHTLEARDLVFVNRIHQINLSTLIINSEVNLSR